MGTVEKFLSSAGSPRLVWLAFKVTSSPLLVLAGCNRRDMCSTFFLFFPNCSHDLRHFGFIPMLSRTF